MEEDNSLEYEVATKIVGSLVRVAVLAASTAYVAYVSGKSSIPADKIVDPAAVTVFADSATSLVIAVLAGLLSVAGGIWEKVTTAKKVQMLKADVYELRARRP